MPRKPQFAPIPLRAMSDSRLTAECWRVLAVVAAHDRLGKNGTGCYASHERLARMARCHTKALSRTLKKLAKCGYLEVAVNQNDRRRSVYFLVYNEGDHELMERENGSDSATEKAAKIPSSGISTAEFGSNPATDFSEVGNTVSEKCDEYQSVDDDKKSSEAIRDHAKHIKINPGEPASSTDDFAEKEVAFANDRDLARYLRETENWLKTQKDLGPFSRQHAKIIQVQDELLRIVECRGDGLTADNLGGWAGRLFDKICEEF